MSALQDDMIQRCEVRMTEATVENSQLQAALREALSRLDVSQSRLTELLSGRAEMRQRLEAVQLAAEVEQDSLQTLVADLQVRQVLGFSDRLLPRRAVQASLALSVFACRDSIALRRMCDLSQVALESSRAESGRQLAAAQRAAVQQATGARAELKAKDELVQQLQQRVRQLAAQLEIVEQNAAVGSATQTFSDD